MEKYDTKGKATPVPKAPDPDKFSLEGTLSDGSVLKVAAEYSPGELRLDLRLFQEELEVDWYFMNNAGFWNCSSAKRPNDVHRENRRKLSRDQYLADFKLYEQMTRKPSFVPQNHASYPAACEDSTPPEDRERELWRKALISFEQTLVDYVSLIAGNYREEVASFIADKLPGAMEDATGKTTSLDLRNIDYAMRMQHQESFQKILDGELRFTNTGKF
ncbi:hypothetical protein KY362_05655 [Candidatus Woesearchaeota archaeon]|nr:hypothetical protein [Candidatus Woesearchaeota archaeon]